MASITFSIIGWIDELSNEKQEYCDLTEYPVSAIFEYDESTTIREFLDYAFNLLNDSRPIFEGSIEHFYHIYNNEMCDFLPDVKLSRFVQQVDSDIIVINYLTGVGGRITKIDGVQLFVRSNENAHSPHIHAWYQGEELSFDIFKMTYKGKFKNKKKMKLVFEYVESHKDELAEIFRMQTNGLDVPLPQ